MLHSIRASIDLRASLSAALESWGEFLIAPLGECAVTFAPLAASRARITVEVPARCALLGAESSEEPARALERELVAFKSFAEQGFRRRGGGRAAPRRPHASRTRRAMLATAQPAPRGPLAP